MGLRDFARSLKPGNDQQLAADLNRQQRVQRSRSATRAARQGQAWEDRDRQQDNRGKWYRPAR
jgi:hypothetical protein